MRFLTKSFFAQIVSTLIPFIVLVSLLYSLLVSSSLRFAEDYIIREYLESEFQQFTDQLKRASQSIPPATSYLHVYWQGDAELDNQFRTYSPGYYELESMDYSLESDGRHILVRSIPGHDQNLIMILDELQFSSISQYETLIDSLLIAVAGIVVLFSGAVAVFIARRLARPMNELANDVANGWQPDKPFFGSDREDEVGQLSRKFTESTEQLQKALKSEKSFSRHVSHELRTPLTVIRNSLAILELPTINSKKKQLSLKRIERACGDIERFTSVFLNLGGQTQPLQKQEVHLHTLIKELLANYSELLSAKNMEIIVEGAKSSSVWSPEAMISLVFDNLIRNALNYGKDSLLIRIDDEGVSFTNALSAEKPKQETFGYGLEIVQRISSQADWKFSTDVKDDMFKAEIRF